MHNRFERILNGMMGLIEDSRSALLSSYPSLSPSSTTRSGILLAVSGGMDSMCLADLALNTLGKDRIAIAHCNFNLRGEESDGDEMLVRRWADENGVSLFVKSFDTEEYAAGQGISIEMAARELRYGWFQELCREHGFGALAVAHNANDNAETLILNLLRGTGLQGLHGMKEVSRWSDVTGAQQPLMIFRPLLSFTRKQIEGHVFAHKIPYRNDSSNFSSEYKRNRIRNEVFPVFEKLNPSFIHTLNREIGFFTDAGGIVEDWCRENVKDVVSQTEPSGKNNEVLSVDIAALLSKRYWTYLLYYILEPYGFNSQVLASMENLLMSGRTVSGKRFEAVDYVAVTGRNVLKVIRAGEVMTSQDEPVMTVRGAGNYHFNGVSFKVEVLPWEQGMPLKQPEGVLVMDAAKLRFPFVCRRWRKGDWFVPFGMKGKKKVSDVFTDLKYDTLEKDEAIMIVDVQSEAMAAQQHVAGIIGVRIDDRYKVTSSTSEIIRIS